MNCLTHFYAWSPIISSLKHNPQSNFLQHFLGIFFSQNCQKSGPWSYTPAKLKFKKYFFPCSTYYLILTSQTDRIHTDNIKRLDNNLNERSLCKNMNITMTIKEAKKILSWRKAWRAQNQTSLWQMISNVNTPWPYLKRTSTINRRRKQMIFFFFKCHCELKLDRIK